MFAGAQGATALRADRPDGCHMPLCAKGAGPCGNTGKHLPADWYLSRDDSLSACTEILRFAQDDCCPAGLPDPRSRSPIPAAPRLRALPQPSAAEPLSNLRTLGAIAPSNFRTLSHAGCQSSCWWEQGFPLSHIPRKKAKHDASPFYFLSFHPFPSILPYCLTFFLISMLPCCFTDMSAY